MNRQLRTVVVLLVALAAAAVASYAVFRALQRAARPAPVAMTTMVIAAREVPVGTMLTAEDVKAVAWPANTVVPATFRTVNDVEGRGTIDILHENEPLVETKLAARGSGAGLPPTIPPGLRAISIKVNEVIGVAGFVLPGSHVDVLVTLANKLGGDKDSSTTRMVVSNVQVLTAGTRFDRDKAQEEGKPIPSTVVTLGVSPDDAERIALAQNQGQITLTLRNPLDVAPTSTPGVMLAHLLGKQTTPPVPTQTPPKHRAQAVVIPPPPVVAVAAPKPYTVETIRAAKRSEETIR
jgi:pilus assembly protein CpaB